MLRHLTATGWQLRRVFDAEMLAAIERAIGETERLHGGEVRFAVEGALSAPELWRDVSPRERAIQLFAELGVWDTAANNGVLIYLLWSDHDVEIVADRGFNDRISAEQWSDVCRRMEERFRANRPKDAVLEGIRAVGALIAQHYPAVDRNELSDRAIMM